MLDCASLDNESYIYMLRNAKIERPKRHSTSHSLTLVYLATI